MIDSGIGTLRKNSLLEREIAKKLVILSRMTAKTECNTYKLKTKGL
jgi:hypothetical protein